MNKFTLKNYCFTSENIGRLNTSLNNPFEIINNKLIFITDDKKLVCFDLNTHKELWKEDYKHFVFPTIYENKLFLPPRDGIILALDINTGETTEIIPVKDLVSFYPPVVYKDRILINYINNLYCLDRKTGKIIWKAETERKIITPIIVKNDTIFFSSENGFVYCLYIKKGELIWKFPDGSRFPPGGAYFEDVDQLLKFLKNAKVKRVNSVGITLYNNKLFIGDKKKGLYCIDADNGKPLNLFKLESGAKYAPIIAHNRIAFVSNNNIIYCLDLNSFQKIWKHELIFAEPSVPKIQDKNILFIAKSYSENFAYSINIITGKQDWKIKNKKVKYTHIYPYKNSFLLASENNNINIFQKDFYKTLFEKFVKEKTSISLGPPFSIVYKNELVINSVNYSFILDRNTLTFKVKQNSKTILETKIREIRKTKNVIINSIDKIYSEIIIRYNYNNFMILEPFVGKIIHNIQDVKARRVKIFNDKLLGIQNNKIIQIYPEPEIKNVIFQESEAIADFLFISPEILITATETGKISATNLKTNTKIFEKNFNDIYITTLVPLGQFVFIATLSSMFGILNTKNFELTNYPFNEAYKHLIKLSENTSLIQMGNSLLFFDNIKGRFFFSLPMQTKVYKIDLYHNIAYLKAKFYVPYENMEIVINENIYIRKKENKFIIGKLNIRKKL